jgi:hypothetical protein
MKSLAMKMITLATMTSEKISQKANKIFGSVVIVIAALKKGKMMMNLAMMTVTMILGMMVVSRMYGVMMKMGVPIMTEHLSIGRKSIWGKNKRISDRVSGIYLRPRV